MPRRNQISPAPMPRRGFACRSHPGSPTREDAAILRGNADAMALRLACHDANVHRRLLPQTPQARAVFEAVEQARVEAIGARRMEGVAQNLGAMLEDRFQHARFGEIRERSEAPLEQAVALMVRERLTGQTPPKSAQRLVDLWRPSSSNAPDAISTSLPPRSRTSVPLGIPSGACSLRSIWARISAPTPTMRKPSRATISRPAATITRPSRASATRAPTCPIADDRNGRSRRRNRGRFHRCGLGRIRGRRRRRPWRRRSGCRCAPSAAEGADRSAGAGLSGFFAQIRRDHRGRSFVRARRIGAVARLSRQAIAESVFGRRAPRQSAAAPSTGPAEPFVGVRPRRRDARCGAAARDVIDPQQPLSFKREKDMDFRDTVVTLLIDNSGSMRGRPITVAAICADILARTLERCGVKVEILGFHHPRLEGRPIARSLAAGRQAAGARPSQRSSPHHLQVGRRALAAGAQESRPDDARGPAQGKHRRRGARLGAPAPARPARTAAHPDGDLGRRAGRRFRPCRSIPATISSGICAT